MIMLFNGSSDNCSCVGLRPKSVRNRSVIEFFVALFNLSFCPFDISVGVGAFVIGLSQISSFSLQWCL